MAELTVGLSMIEKPLFLVDYGYNIIKNWSAYTVLRQKDEDTRYHINGGFQN